jgi:negative regulator of flagellin synthesis FlgM
MKVMKMVSPPDTAKTSMKSIIDNQRLQRSAEPTRSDAIRQQPEPEPLARVKDVVLSEPLALAMKSAEYDENKVKQISDAIREGNYPLDARKIAESFIPLEKLL